MFRESFEQRVKESESGGLGFSGLEILQVNVGNRCNQQCRHCHHEAGPDGDKVMDREVTGAIVRFLGWCAEKYPGITLDITGGAPELNPGFRYLVDRASVLLDRVMVRTNLTVFYERGMEDLADFYRDRGVVLIASLPCYLRENVEGQRGAGVYDKSIRALKQLNQRGYGKTLELNLVYNPGGDTLPPDQQHLEKEYKDYIMGTLGIRFNHLFTLANVPLGRFKRELDAQCRYENYLELLERHFNPSTLPGVMCRHLISVDYRGVLYNCDFNQAGGLPIRSPGGRPATINQLPTLLQKAPEIRTGAHCYCCTAGSGSSCSGALT